MVFANHMGAMEERQLADRPLVHITLKEVALNVVAVAGVFGLCMVHQYLAALVFVVLALAALGSALNAYRVVFMLTPLVYMNPYLGGSGPGTMIFRWLAFAAVCGRCFWDGFNHRGAIGGTGRRALWALAAFCAIALVSSLLADPAGVPALFKLVSFSLGAFALVFGARAVQGESHRLLAWILAVGLFVAFGSLIMATDSRGYLDKQALELFHQGMGGPVDDLEEVTGGLMGLLSHSQSLGVFMAIYGTAMLVLSIATVHTRIRLVSLVGYITSLVLIFLSQTRTAGVAIILTSVAVVAYVSVFSGGGRPLVRAISWRLSLVLFLLAGLVVGILGFIRGESPVEMAQSFIAKGGTSDADVLKQYQQSRGGLIARGLRNWQKSPVLGNGFACDSTNIGLRRSDLAEPGLMKYFYSPSEKGMIIAAVLEEVGVIGFLAFAAVIGTLVGSFWRGANPFGLGLVFIVLLCNFGEMNLFSVGGLGLLQWGVIASSLVLGPHCHWRNLIPRSKPNLVRVRRGGQMRSA